MEVSIGMARRIAHTNDVGKITEIDEVIHDCFFSPEDIVFVRSSSVLSIKFSREALAQSTILERGWLLKKWQVPVLECLLKFYHVNSYTIEDTEHVGRYNFNDLEYDRQQRLIKVNTGVTIKIEIKVESFEVAVEETGKIVELKIIRSAFNLRKL